MKTLIVGVGGMTNGGKSTLSKTLQEKIPTSCIIAQDSFFKDDSVVPVDDNGFKQYDTLDALHMDAMMSRVDAWRGDPQAFLRETGQTAERMTLSADHVFVLIVEGFLIFNHRPLNELMDKRYFMEIPYDICKERRSLRVYKPPDPPGYFDGHVWPMYLKNRQKMENTVVGIVFLDGMKSKEELMAVVFQDVSQEINMLRGELPVSYVHRSLNTLKYMFKHNAVIVFTYLQSRIEEGASIISSAPNELEDLSGS
ncbi:nicotinamide riboside kinase 1 isoform X2 [Phyllopteryx taeniolatus]|uniref:nicotinamide riboside kinase 1 isoform X2 n=1 Tax=Phyllopteryx taeniolatus TaxID=161469 RepID=UPI002AD4230B|nr:nicotinamide riboside kinase 1 isoform X2 [Phyllopteryx taeniolatus]